MIDAIATHARARPGKIALVDLASGRIWSYAALDRAVDRAAGWLVAALGPASGARVATLARNCAGMIVLQHACVRAGAIFVPLNWRLAPAELAALAAQAEPAILFRDMDFEAPPCGAVFYLADLEALSADSPGPPATARRGMDAPATLLFTSGTSGRPKGVIVTEANAFWGSTNFIHGNAVGADSIFLCDMPLFHTAGLFAAARTPILSGGTLLISRGFDAGVTLARLADRALGVTHYFSVPQMARAMWDRPEFNPSMLTGLQVYAMGGAPNPAAQIERFVAAGVRMSDGFGMSETCSNFGMPVDDPAVLLAKAGSCGVPYLSVLARIVADSGEDVPDGTTGELWLAGPSVTPGYWQVPDLTAQAFAEGWFRTGDMARRDADGFYYVVDRKKAMFISGGENVYPAEVEAVLSELVEIAEVAVVGMTDERWGEVGRAHIVLAEGATITEQTIRKHCAGRLAKFKVPASIVFTTAIPRTASGKVQKHLLVETQLS